MLDRSETENCSYASRVGATRRGYGRNEEQLPGHHLGRKAGACRIAIHHDMSSDSAPQTSTEYISASAKPEASVKSMTISPDLSRSPRLADSPVALSTSAPVSLGLLPQLLAHGLCRRSFSTTAVPCDRVISAAFRCGCGEEQHHTTADGCQHHAAEAGWGVRDRGHRMW